jgi:hypothetical protein
MKVVFVVRCKSCNDIVGAYAPDRSDTADMGVAIRWAAKHQGTIAFEPSPVEVVVCTCGGDGP